MSEENIKDKMDRLLKQQEELIEQKKAKKWKLPFKGRVSKSQIKKGYVSMLFLMNNNRAKFMKVPVDQATTLVDGEPRMATIDDTLILEDGTPLIIQPEWDIRPFSKTASFDSAKQEKHLAIGRKLIINRMKSEAIVPKKMGGSLITWIIIGLVLVGAIYYLMGGKLF